MEPLMKQINFKDLAIILFGLLINGLVWAFDGHGGHHGGGHFGGGHFDGHFGGGHFGGHHGLDLHFGYGLGLGYGLGYYGFGIPHYYPYPPVMAVPAPVVTVPASPQTYIQHDISPAPQPQTSYWHYCRNPEGYYPYVRDCPGGWEKISPQPPAQ